MVALIITASIIILFNGAFTGDTSQDKVGYRHVEIARIRSLLQSGEDQSRDEVATAIHTEINETRDSDSELRTAMQVIVQPLPATIAGLAIDGLQGGVLDGFQFDSG